MNLNDLKPLKGNVYIETYGCQMNVGDSEIVASILKKDRWQIVDSLALADVALVNTCAIRQGAEEKIFGRLKEWRAAKRTNKHLLVGVIGCMAERLKETLFENNMADIVAGPDTYRAMPQLIERAAAGEKAINTLLSTQETYAEIEPVRLSSNGVSAFVSIMRGCNNFCAYCVVPYTRGRERSRSVSTIVAEVRALLAQNYHQVTLLGQNVNSYNDQGVDFADLLTAVSEISPQLRVRFSTSHPKDFSDRVIQTMRTHPNIGRSIHLPAQSGSDAMLEKMKRRYTHQWYMDRIEAIKRNLPDCTITTDLIAGFSGETIEDHLQTLSLMRQVGYSYAYMFAYSQRPGTFAAANLADDVEQKEKIRRLSEIIELQNSLSLQNNENDVGRIFEVLIEGHSKRSEQQMFGHTSQNKIAVFDSVPGLAIGDFVKVKVLSVSSATLHAVIVM
ncbi:MAG: tRNA (N6-isopentenyl adenosine(37)-C2)-methylthiotransferase MiaB [Mucinivorans sp.]